MTTKEVLYNLLQTPVCVNTETSGNSFLLAPLSHPIPDCSNISNEY